MNSSLYAGCIIPNGCAEHRCGDDSSWLLQRCEIAWPLTSSSLRLSLCLSVCSVSASAAPNTSNSTGGGRESSMYALLRLPTEGRIRGPRRQRGQQARDTQWACGHLSALQGSWKWHSRASSAVQASRPFITRSPRATDRLFHLLSLMDLDGCTITQSSASSRPLELLVRWSEDRLGAVSHSNALHHLSVS